MGPPNKNNWTLSIIAIYSKPLIYGFTVTNVVKNFACGGLSLLLYFNFVHGFINYLCTIVTNAVKKFTCGGLSLLLYFNFVHGFINYLCTIVTNAVKNFACGELSLLLYFNFVHDFIRYLCANCDKCCKKNSPANKSWIRSCPRGG